jgi:sulfite exporter TauE/SafE
VTAAFDIWYYLPCGLVLSAIAASMSTNVQGKL